MMSISLQYEKSLTLLRSALWRTPCSVSLSAQDWKGIVCFASEQVLDGILPDAIALLSRGAQPATAAKMRMIAQQLQVEKANARMNGELQAFTEELERRSIPYVLLKGQGVASLYPAPHHRTPGDIDLYVPANYLKEVACGFDAFGATRTAETRHHINYQARGVEWELHHCIYYFQKDSRNVRFMHYVDEAMQEPPVYAKIEDAKVRVLPPTTNVLMLLAHILDHFYCQGVGLRQLCDYALMLDSAHKDIDRKQLMKALGELSLTKAYRVFGQLCVQNLGLSPDKLILQPRKSDKRLAHSVMKDCLRGGNFGRNDHKGRATLWNSLIYYTRFFGRLVRFGGLCPSEALWWPLAKLKRYVTGTVQLSEEKSVLNTLNK